VGGRDGRLCGQLLFTHLAFDDFRVVNVRSAKDFGKTLAYDSILK
jgi:hypothetical protein